MFHATSGVHVRAGLNQGLNHISAAGHCAFIAYAIKRSVASGILAIRIGAQSQKQSHDCQIARGGCRMQ